MQEINLYKLLAFYARNWILILSLTAAGLLGGFIYNQYVQVPMYKSDATILFIDNSATSTTQDVTISNYVELFKSRRVLEPVIKDQKLSISYETLVKSVSATNEKGTQVIRLNVSTDSPSVSRNFLTAAVISFKEKVKELYGSDKLQIVDDASSAETPFNVHEGLQLAIGAGAGFATSLIVLFFIYDVRGDTPLIKKKAKTIKNTVKTQKPLKIKKVNTRNVKAKVGPKDTQKNTAIRIIKTYFTEPKEDMILLSSLESRMRGEEFYDTSASFPDELDRKRKNTTK